jgi:hypothetical protein
VRGCLDKAGIARSKIKTNALHRATPHAIMGKHRLITIKAHGVSSAGVIAKVHSALGEQLKPKTSSSARRDGRFLWGRAVEPAHER